ncbi:MAG: hypothetical protein VYA69_03460 [Gemmatimonadota bacterium]|nr:hypothetical protein [Gemmatimonadota bacterium]
MKLRYLVCITLSVSLAGCAAYSELNPKPPITSIEGDYIELTKARSQNKIEQFELKAEKQYYVRFPVASASNFYLVLRNNRQALMNTYLIATKPKKNETGVRMRDMAGGRVGIDAYPIPPTAEYYYWVVETVSQDLTLTLDYRYVPIWRYTFETKRDEFHNRLSENRIDRANYELLGGAFHFDTGYDYTDALNQIASANGNLQTLNAELQDLENLFPTNILNSDDRAYLDYLDLRSHLENELNFQDNYQEVLNTFQKESSSRGNMQAFLNVAPDFVSFLGQADRFPEGIIREGQSVLGGRMTGVVPYLEQQIATKEYINPVTFTFDLGSVDGLYRATGQGAPGRFLAIVEFIEFFNKEAERIAPALDRLAQAQTYANARHTWPSNSHYTQALGHMAELDRLMPNASSVSFRDYDHFRCVMRINEELERIGSLKTRLNRDYNEAQGVVRQVNTLRSQREYRAIVQLLASHRRLGFLMQQYSSVDQLSLEQQQTAIEVSLQARVWQEAEAQLKELHEDEVFLRPNSIAATKRAAVDRLEGRLSSAVERGSKELVDAFVEQNRLTIDRVEDLYQDPVFIPVYKLTFTSGHAVDLARRNVALQDYLDSLKTEVFPAAAIPEIYREFVRNLGDLGVEKARAIIVHGANYNGTDRRIKNLVAECDPYTPKWITKPAEYRKIYVLPTSTNPNGENQYLLRLNVRIPTQAKFPVFDVNIKLPEGVAANATTEQWYDYISLNKEQLKPQGRFTITAPTAANNYEAQLTPVQMKANENNILELQFTHPSFQVFEVSTMSQRPIMRKD